MKPRLMALVWSATLGVAWPAPAQTARNHPFEGHWSLEFSAATRPGGETLHRGPVTISPQNLHFTASRADFQVSADGKFAWTERKSGQWQQDATNIDARGQRSFPSQTNEPILKASGQLDRERNLTLTLQWTHGSGPFIAGDGATPGSLVVSADGAQVTVFFKGGTSSHASRYLTTEWTLAPSITKNDLGPDQQEERCVYSATRRRALGQWGAGPLPVTETIRVEQVRMLKLVPRG